MCSDSGTGGLSEITMEQMFSGAEQMCKVLGASCIWESGVGLSGFKFALSFTWKMSVVLQAQFSMALGTVSITLLLHLSSGLL